MMVSAVRYLERPCAAQDELKLEFLAPSFQSQKCQHFHEPEGDLIQFDNRICIDDDNCDNYDDYDDDDGDDDDDDDDCLTSHITIVFIFDWMKLQHMKSFYTIWGCVSFIRTHPTDFHQGVVCLPWKSSAWVVGIWKQPLIYIFLHITRTTTKTGKKTLNKNWPKNKSDPKIRPPKLIYCVYFISWQY